MAIPRPDDEASWQKRLKAVFDEAQSVARLDREEFVRARTSDNPALGDAVLSLVRASEAAATTALRDGVPRDLLAVLRSADPASQRVRSAATDALLQRLRAAPPLHGDRYAREGELGAGGMGDVFAVRDQNLNRLLAMKVLRRRDEEGAEAQQLSRQLLARFLEEAQVTSQLDHPGVVPVHELGLDQSGSVCFTMRLVKGRTASEVFRLARERRDDWTPTRALEVLLKVCDTMAFAHDKGVLHRDLKPSNVMIGAFGEVYVMDWGLAKVVGSGGDAQATTIDSFRKQVVETGDGSSLLSLNGQKLGTPSYMSPEQARAEPLDERTDVYAVGSMLYELLVGRAPYTTPGVRRGALAILDDVVTGPPAQLDDLAPDAPPELAAIANRAMAREAEGRYRSMLELAADVRAFLDQRAVKAYRTGALVELRLWVRRNKALASAIAFAAVILVVGITVSTLLANSFGTKVREFDQLAGVVLYERTIDNEKNLYPPWPHKVAAMEKWLKEDAGRLLAMRPEIERTIRDLEADASPYTPEDQEADRRSHPKFRDYELLQRYIASLRHAEAIHSGRKSLVEPSLSPEHRSLPVSALNAIAIERITPEMENRRVWAEEPLGLAAARLAASKAEGTQEEPATLNTLAWALMANGRFDEAREMSEEALEMAPQAREAEYRRYANAVEQQGRDFMAVMRSREAALEQLAAIVAQRRTFRFVIESSGFLHRTLNDLLNKIDSLAPARTRTEENLRWAREIFDVSVAGPSAMSRWDEARAAMANNPIYSSLGLTLNSQDVIGLLPIGENPTTHLWDFYELRSAWDGIADPHSIAIPKHEADGSIKVDAATGIIFTLLPGGDFVMGAQRASKADPNHDPEAAANETPHSVRLGPFFLARHEMTRAQWQRLTAIRTFWWQEGTNYDGDPIPIGPTHPADWIDWHSADLWMTRHGLRLPTEAQWEYACRAGSRTGWWPGPHSGDLQGTANVHDRTSIRSEWGTPTSIVDGFTAIAPVGNYRSSPFGLFDMHGNVWEWCLDWYGEYSAPVREGDGTRLLGAPSGNRVLRGGSYSNSATHARSSCRAYYAPSIRSQNLGVRPARALRVGS